MGLLKKTNLYFFISCSIGLFLSCYALIVEQNSEHAKDYKAFCDINEYISCTKAFSSKYGKGFGIIGPILGEDSILNKPNSLSGIVFYSLLALSSWSTQKLVVKIQITSCIISNILSLYLAYVLYFILLDFCVICVATYVINAINLTLSLIRWSQINTCVPKQFVRSHVQKND